MMFTLEITCDHDGWPAERGPVPAPVVVTVIAHRTPLPERSGVTVVGRTEWVELNVGTAPAEQTLYGEARRLGRDHLAHRTDELVPGMNAGQRWRFECDVCHATLPLRHANAARLFAGAEQMRRTTVSLVELADWNGRHANNS